MNRYWSFALLAAGLGLAACGGGSSDDEAASFADLVAEGEALDALYGEAAVTPNFAMPVTGSATYTGIAGYSTLTSDSEAIIASPESVSRISLDADFAAQTISGSAYDFESVYGYDIDGDLEIGAGVMNGNVFAATIGGTLNENGVDVSYLGGIVGNFVGGNAEAVVGEGSAIGTTETGEQIEVFGVFAAD